MIRQDVGSPTPTSEAHYNKGINPENNGENHHRLGATSHTRQQGGAQPKPALSVGGAAISKSNLYDKKTVRHDNKGLHNAMRV